MSAAVTHVIGAGLAGLSSAVRLAEAGREVVVYEAAGHAGGRCRSFYDETLERTIDNGNHLLLSGNAEAVAYLDLIGAADSLAGPGEAAFPFVDFETGERWTVRPNAGLVPWWVFDGTRRVPGTSPWSYFEAVRLACAGAESRVADCLTPDGALFRRLWEPLAVAALNTSAREGAAALLWPVIRESFGRGEAACRPRIARDGLSRSFIDPALRRLEGKGVSVRFNTRVRAVAFAGDRVASFDAGGETVELGENDSVVLAVPPAVAGELVRGLRVPDESRAIVNGHFLLPEAQNGQGFIGVIGGLCHWIFFRGDIASTTVSAAETLVDEPAADIAAKMWDEIGRALELPEGPLPRYRIVKEKRATFAQTPEQAALRPKTETSWKNLLLAGDWTDTGLPATIESAIRSGRRAAAAVGRFVSIP